ncbi:MAG TPA: hypothetical protein PLG67_06140 [Bacillota bacterium]|jgi:hypothetical protein|nr:hypothetical protein [Bacillota bacterium]HQE66325.1 hypothetical protein [Bacillota bacterium]HQL36161.1 hypothetical protein [Bacillota bacterium]
MNKNVLNVGCWSAVTASLTFVAYTICFIAILLVNPIFIWTDFETYINAVQTTNQTFKHIAMLFMILFGACFVIQLCSIEEIAESSKKYFARIAELFGIGFFALTGINYFIQISAVRMQINSGQTNGLEQFIQANPVSAIAAVNMLGWTVFFGLSCSFAAWAFGNTRTERIIKYAFLTNGIMMFASAFGYLFDIVVIVFLCLNIGMGVAVLTVEIYLSKLFKSLQKSL